MDPENQQVRAQVTEALPPMGETKMEFLGVAGLCAMSQQKEALCISAFASVSQIEKKKIFWKICGKSELKETLILVQKVLKFMHSFIILQTYDEHLGNLFYVETSFIVSLTW